jgi:N-acetylmuramoyl-L-alanine amidase
MSRFIVLSILFLCTQTQCYWPFVYEQQVKPLSIMLDPAGDAGYTGRIIEDSFERGITLQWAETIKKKIEEKYDKQVRVVLTRFPGETLERLQNAHFANRLDVDLYLNVHFFKQTQRNSIFLYYFMYHPITDLWSKPHRLSLYPYDQAHLLSINKTTSWIERFKLVLKNDVYKNLFEVKGPYGLPLRPLIGIKSPAIALEIGLKNKSDWQLYIEPIMQCLDELLQFSKA